MCRFGLWKIVMHIFHNFLSVITSQHQFFFFFNWLAVVIVNYFDSQMFVIFEKVKKMWGFTSFVIYCSELSTMGFGLLVGQKTFKHDLGLCEVVIFFSPFFFLFHWLNSSVTQKTKLEPPCINTGFMYGTSWCMHWDLFRSTCFLSAHSLTFPLFFPHISCRS